MITFKEFLVFNEMAMSKKPTNIKDLFEKFLASVKESGVPVGKEVDEVSEKNVMRSFIAMPAMGSKRDLFGVSNVLLPAIPEVQENDSLVLFVINPKKGRLKKGEVRKTIVKPFKIKKTYINEFKEKLSKNLRSGATIENAVDIDMADTVVSRLINNGEYTAQKNEFTNLWKKELIKKLKDGNFSPTVFREIFNDSRIDPRVKEYFINNKEKLTRQLYNAVKGSLSSSERHGVGENPSNAEGTLGITKNISLDKDFETYESGTNLFPLMWRYGMGRLLIDGGDISDLNPEKIRVEDEKSANGLMNNISLYVIQDVAKLSRGNESRKMKNSKVKNSLDKEFGSGEDGGGYVGSDNLSSSGEMVRTKRQGGVGSREKEESAPDVVDDDDISALSLAPEKEDIRVPRKTNIEPEEDLVYDYEADQRERDRIEQEELRKIDIGKGTMGRRIAMGEAFVIGNKAPKGTWIAGAGTGGDGIPKMSFKSYRKKRSK